MSSHKDELLAKKARLAELKRQRALREEQYTSGRHSLGEVGLIAPTKVELTALIPSRLLPQAGQQRSVCPRSTTLCLV